MAVQAREQGRGKAGSTCFASGPTAAPDRRGAHAAAAGAAGRQAETTAASLPHGDQRKLEVALLMALDPKVYMFDEPTAGMSVDDVPVVLDLIRALKSRKDCCILLVEHKMDVVRELSDRIVVLHNGAKVADGEPGAVIASPIVQQAYLGIVPEEATV